MPNDIFVLTGAGVSAESGLGTFRDKRGEGLWARFDPMKLATPEAFANNPEDVLAFYDMRGATSSAPSPTPPIARWLGSKERSPSAAGASPWSRRTSTICTSGPGPGASSTCTVNS
jgi:hypothetical protein